MLSLKRGMIPPLLRYGEDVNLRVSFQKKLSTIRLYLLIAQLVERMTVVGRLLSSGRWFDSGSADVYFLMSFNELKQCVLLLCVLYFILEMTSWNPSVSRNRRAPPILVPTISTVPADLISSFLELKQHVEIAFENAEKDESKITDGILNMEGMSGKKTRHFYNNLLNMDDARYLEIGTWKGSSVCSAMCGNKAKIVCIDNWSEFGGPKSEFLTNFNTYKGENEASFIEQDCYKVNTLQLPRFNIYMYDGNHTQNSHYKALVHYYRCLDNMFVFIVDDWNWKGVRDGTYDSFNKLNLSVLYEKNIRTTDDDSHPPWGSEKQQQWHNGIYVAILKKN